jgi:Collagen triple helix repeat (20 copies)
MTKPFYPYGNTLPGNASDPYDVVKQPLRISNIESIAGPTGAQGTPGATGAQGPQGIQGPQGPAGVVGPTGPTGPTGAAGATGATGVGGTSHVITGFSGGVPQGTAVQDAGSIIFRSLVADRIITGFDWSSTGAQTHLLINADSTYSITVQHAGSAGPFKQILNTGNTSIILPPGAQLSIVYDSLTGNYRSSSKVYASSIADALGGLRTVDLDTFVPGADGVMVTTIAYSDATGDYKFDRPGDMGGADWVWKQGDATAANGYNIRGTTGSGRWLMVPQAKYLVTQFGCKPGSSVDNGAIITGAFDALRAARPTIISNGGGSGRITLHLPRSSWYYECTTSVLIPSDEYAGREYELTGDGWRHGLNGGHYGYPFAADTNPRSRLGGSVLKFPANTDGIKWQGNGLDAAYARFEGIAVMGASNSTSMCRGISQGAEGLGRTDFKNVHVCSFWVGVDMGQAVSARNITDLVIWGCWRGLVAGVAEVKYYGLDIQGCGTAVVIRDCYDIGIYASLFQNNMCHVQFGSEASDGGRSIWMEGIHFEGADQWVVTAAALENSTNRTLSGLQTVDGMTGTNGMITALNAQTNPLENGVWYQRVGAWERVPFANQGPENAILRGTRVIVTGGSVNSGTWLLDDSTGPGKCGYVPVSLFKLSALTTYGQPLIRSREGGSSNYTSLSLRDSDFSDAGVLRLRNGLQLHADRVEMGGVLVDVPSDETTEFTFSHSKILGFVETASGQRLAGTLAPTGQILEQRRRTYMGNVSSYTARTTNGSYYRQQLEQPLFLAEPQGFGSHSRVNYLVSQSVGGHTLDADWAIGFPRFTTGPSGSYLEVEFEKEGTTWRCTYFSGWRYYQEIFYGPSGPDISAAPFTLDWNSFHTRQDPRVNWTGSSAGTWTVPTDSTLPLPIGQTIEIFIEGAGQLTIAAAGGVTLRAPKGAKSAFQFGWIRLRKLAANVWHVDGDVIV